MLRFVAMTMLVIVAALPCQAKVQTKTVEYEDGDVKLVGHLAWDDAVDGKRPGVLVVHEWWGLNDYARSRAEKLASMGYVAFALDMYGEGKVTEHPQEAGKWAAEIRANQKAWTARAQAGLNVLLKQESVDGKRVAAIGYCFGGSTVLQMAFSGAELAGVVSFHGALPTPDESQAKQIKSRILVCHGADDGFISEESIQSFRSALNEAGADYQMIYYSGARHSFTNPDADKRGIDGLRYNKSADQRSWQHMQQFFAEIFAKQ